MRSSAEIRVRAERAFDRDPTVPQEVRDLVVDVLVDAYGFFETSTRIANALERVAAALEKTAHMGRF